MSKTLGGGLTLLVWCTKHHRWFTYRRRRLAVRGCTWSVSVIFRVIRVQSTWRHVVWLLYEHSRIGVWTITACVSSVRCAVNLWCHGICHSGSLLNCPLTSWNKRWNNVELLDEERLSVPIDQWTWYMAWLRLLGRTIKGKPRKEELCQILSGLQTHSSLYWIYEIRAGSNHDNYQHFGIIASEF